MRIKRREGSNVDRYLADVLPDDAVPLAYELFGYALYPRNPPHVAVLLSAGRNGKGTFLRLMNSLLGASNCSSVTLQMLTEDRSVLAGGYRPPSRGCHGARGSGTNDQGAWAEARGHIVSDIYQDAGQGPHTEPARSRLRYLDGRDRTSTTGKSKPSSSARVLGITTAAGEPMKSASTACARGCACQGIALL